MIGAAIGPDAGAEAAEVAAADGAAKNAILGSVRGNPEVAVEPGRTAVNGAASPTLRDEKTLPADGACSVTLGPSPASPATTGPADEMAGSSAAPAEPAAVPASPNALTPSAPPVPLSPATAPGTDPSVVGADRSDAPGLAGEPEPTAGACDAGRALTLARSIARI